MNTTATKQITVLRQLAATGAHMWVNRRCPCGYYMLKTREYTFHEGPIPGVYYCCEKCRNGLYVPIEDAAYNWDNFMTLPK